MDVAGVAVLAEVTDLGRVWDYELPDDRFRVPYHCHRFRVRFVAEVPAFGYTTYRAVPSHAAPPAFPEDEPTVLDNGLLKVMLGPAGSSMSPLSPPAGPSPGSTRSTSAATMVTSTNICRPGATGRSVRRSRTSGSGSLATTRCRSPRAIVAWVPSDDDELEELTDLPAMEAVVTVSLAAGSRRVEVRVDLGKPDDQLPPPRPLPHRLRHLVRQRGWAF
ncbi:MAG: hypothetical protein M5U09_19205 [Gammaproteobacteria bacterium]|nr:hypothetical protein [Gammaproteobacteria bacterium]